MRILQGVHRPASPSAFSTVRRILVPVHALSLSHSPSLCCPSLQLRLPVCLKLHTVVLLGHGVCSTLALPPSTRSLVLDNVMRDARSLSLATMVRSG